MSVFSLLFYKDFFAIAIAVVYVVVVAAVADDEDAGLDVKTVAVH